MAKRRISSTDSHDGWQGWEEYAPFYDWENRQTIGRRDLKFWREFVASRRGLVLELGCGTGRVSIPLARSGAAVIGVDRSPAMLTHARKRARRAGASALQLIRADLRALPIRDRGVGCVIAPYGVVQSLVRRDDVAATFASVGRVLARGGIFGIDLVGDLPAWQEYRNQVRLRGRLNKSTQIRLVESVRQEPSRRLTIFEQCFVLRRGGRSTEHRFQLRFRTPSIAELTGQLREAGLEVEATFGGYTGDAWRTGDETCVIVARRP